MNSPKINATIIITHVCMNFIVYCVSLISVRFISLMPYWLYSVAFITKDGLTELNLVHHVDSQHYNDVDKSIIHFLWLYLYQNVSV